MALKVLQATRTILTANMIDRNGIPTKWVTYDNNGISWLNTIVINALRKNSRKDLDKFDLSR